MSGARDAGMMIRKTLDSGLSGGAFRLVCGLLFIFVLVAQAGPPAPKTTLRLPKTIDGDFTYVEYTKSDNPERFVEDQEKLTVELTLVLWQQDPNGQMAFYKLDNAGFRAEGKETFVIKSPGSNGCVETHVFQRTGSGLLESYAQAGPPITPTVLIWLISEKRFSLTFVSPEEKGTQTRTSSYSCTNDKPAPITSPYGWTISLEGAVDYDARTGTYRFVLLDKYEVPYREIPDLKSSVYVLGELRSKAK